jgi:hypothetical protein
MKTFLVGAPNKCSAAVNCLIVNQFATPGLGSLMARRYLAGIVQLLLSVSGFCLVLVWFVQMGFRTYRLVMELPPEIEHYSWMGGVGALLFLVSWLLAWFTSLSVLREARKAAAEKALRPIPPMI